MTTKTLDQIVRNELINSQLTLHHYVQFLFYGISELKKLSDIFNFNLSQVELTVVNRTAAIPSTVRRVVGVSLIEGERLLPIAKDEKLNPDGLEYPSPDTSGYVGPYEVKDSNLTYNTNESDDEIIFSTEAGYNKHRFMLIYEPILFSTTAATLVPIIFERVVELSIRLQRAKNSRSERGDVNRVNEILVIERDYKSAKRISKTYLNSFTTDDLFLISRRSIHNSIKN